MAKQSIAGHYVCVECRDACQASELDEGISISLGDSVGLLEFSESKAEAVFTVMLPNTSEVGLG
jgi:hypothetical protein